MVKLKSHPSISFQCQYGKKELDLSQVKCWLIHLCTLHTLVKIAGMHKNETNINHVRSFEAYCDNVTDKQEVMLNGKKKKTLRQHGRVTNTLLTLHVFCRNASLSHSGKEFTILCVKVPGTQRFLKY